MAVLPGRNFIRLTTAGNAITGVVEVTTIIFTANGTNAGNFDLKNDAGDLFLRVRVNSTSSGGPTTYAIPINTSLDGIEMDVIPTGGFITVLTK